MYLSGVTPEPRMERSNPRLPTVKRTKDTRDHSCSMSDRIPTPEHLCLKDPPRTTWPPPLWQSALSLLINNPGPVLPKAMVRVQGELRERQEANRPWTSLHMAVSHEDVWATPLIVRSLGARDETVQEDRVQDPGPSVRSVHHLDVALSTGLLGVP